MAEFSSLPLIPLLLSLSKLLEADQAQPVLAGTELSFVFLQHVPCIIVYGGYGILFPLINVTLLLMAHPAVGNNVFEAHFIWLLGICSSFSLRLDLAPFRDSDLLAGVSMP